MMIKIAWHEKTQEALRFLKPLLSMEKLAQARLVFLSHAALGKEEHLGLNWRILPPRPDLPVSASHPPRIQAVLSSIQGSILSNDLKGRSLWLSEQSTRAVFPLFFDYGADEKACHILDFFLTEFECAGSQWHLNPEQTLQALIPRKPWSEWKFSHYEGCFREDLLTHKAKVRF